MEREDKEILLRDLSARLPYGVIVDYKENDFEFPHWKITTIYPETLDVWIGYDKRVGAGSKSGSRLFNIGEFKPYLRSLSSMTEEEKRELSKKYVWDISCGQIKIRYHSDGYWDNNTKCPTSEYLRLFDWLNMHHFDYHGLIEKGLALEAPKGMYNEIKEEKK